MPANKIQKTIKEGINKLTDKKNQILFDKLYKDYTTENRKYNELYYIDLNKDNAKPKAGADIAKKAATAKKKIDTLVQKMQKFPDLYEIYKLTVEYNVKVRENAFNTYSLNRLNTTIRENMLGTQKLSLAINAQQTLLGNTTGEIEKLQSLTTNQPAEDARIKAQNNKEKEALKQQQLAAHAMVKASKGNNPEAQKRLEAVSQKLRIHEQQYQDSLRSTSDDINKKNQDHLEFLRAQADTANEKINTYEGQVRQLTKGTTTFRAQAETLRKKIAEFEKLEQPVLPTKQTKKEKIQTVMPQTPESAAKAVSSQTFDEAAQILKKNASLLQASDGNQKISIGNHRQNLNTSPSQRR